MEWTTEILNKIVLSVVGVVVSGLGTIIISWIRSKMKQEKLDQTEQSILQVVQDAVSYVCQTYVDTLKSSDKWDAAAMEQAHEKAMEYIEDHLSTDMVDFLASKLTVSLTQWLEEQIEIAVQKNKNGN